jgi:hypothetical protein
MEVEVLVRPLVAQTRVISGLKGYETLEGTGDLGKSTSLAFAQNGEALLGLCEEHRVNSD